MGNSGSLGKNEINYELIGMAKKVESKYEESLAEFRPWGGGEDEQVTKDLSFEGANIYRAWLKGGG